MSPRFGQNSRGQVRDEHCSSRLRSLEACFDKRHAFLSLLFVLAALPLVAGCGKGASPGFKGGIFDTRDKIAFVSDNHLYLVNADGTGLTRLSRSGDSHENFPRWSPDGSRIAFLSGGNVWTMDLATGTTAKLTHTDTFKRYLSWSPDGKKLSFQSTASDYNRAGISSIDDVCVVNADGSGLLNLTNNQKSLQTNDPGDWSPDGRKILLTSDRDGGRDVYAVSAEDGSLVRLGVGPPSSHRDDPTWSPDGSHIALSTFTFFDDDISIMNADGSSVRRIYSSEGNPSIPESPVPGLTKGNASLPQWSPSGDRIAFVASWRVDNGDTGDIYVVNADGSGLANLTNNPASDGLTVGDERRGFSWSPDSTRLVFISDRDGSDDLYVMMADGSGVVQITAGSGRPGEFGWNMDSPAWSPAR